MTNPNEIPCVSREWDKYCDLTDDSADVEREIAIDEEVEKLEVVLYRKGSGKWSYQVLEDGEVLHEVKDYYEDVTDAQSDAEGTRHYYAEKNAPRAGDDFDGSENDDDGGDC